LRLDLDVKRCDGREHGDPISTKQAGRGRERWDRGAQ
jgi:hypothetical protein